MNKKFIRFILRQNKSKTGDPERNVIIAHQEIITCLHSFSQLPANADSDYQPKITKRIRRQGLMTIYAGAIFLG